MLTTQGIADQIYAVDKSIIENKKELDSLEKQLVNSDLYQRLQELKAKQKTLDSEKLELKNQWKAIMLEAWLKKVEVLGWIVIQLNKKPWSLVIEDIEAPELDQYKKEKITVSLDKTAIKKDIKSGIMIPWAHISEDYDLIIKYAW